MSGANEARGEFEIELEGVSYGMRPSFEAIVAFEKATGQALLDLTRAASGQSLTVTDAAAIVTECCKAWGRATGDRSAANFNAGRVGELLIETGMLFVMKRLELMLFMAATGGVTSSGEVKPRMATTATSPTGTPTAD